MTTLVILLKLASNNTVLELSLQARLINYVSHSSKTRKSSFHK